MIPSFLKKLQLPLCTQYLNCPRTSPQLTMSTYHCLHFSNMFPLWLTPNNFLKMLLLSINIVIVIHKIKELPHWSNNKQQILKSVKENQTKKSLIGKKMEEISGRATDVVPFHKILFPKNAPMFSQRQLHSHVLHFLKMSPHMIKSVPILPKCPHVVFTCPNVPKCHYFPNSLPTFRCLLIHKIQEASSLCKNVLTP